MYLIISYNNITDLTVLQLNKIPSLRSLFLQGWIFNCTFSSFYEIFLFLGNEISKVDGLEALRSLRELVLDKNKIRVITETSFFFQTNLIELHLEENRIRELSYFDRMIKLEKLFLGSNKVSVTILLSQDDKRKSVCLGSLWDRKIKSTDLFSWTIAD